MFYNIKHSYFLKVYFHVDPQALKLKKKKKNSVTETKNEEIAIYKEKKDSVSNYPVQITTAICSMHII